MLYLFYMLFVCLHKNSAKSLFSLNHLCPRMEFRHLYVKSATARGTKVRPMCIG